MERTYLGKDTALCVSRNVCFSAHPKSPVKFTVPQPSHDIVTLMPYKGNFFHSITKSSIENMESYIEDDSEEMQIMSSRHQIRLLTTCEPDVYTLYLEKPCDPRYNYDDIKCSLCIAVKDNKINRKFATIHTSNDDDEIVFKITSKLYFYIHILRNNDGYAQYELKCHWTGHDNNEDSEEMIYESTVGMMKAMIDVVRDNKQINDDDYFTTCYLKEKNNAIIWNV